MVEKSKIMINFLIIHKLNQCLYLTKKIKGFVNLKKKTQNIQIKLQSYTVLVAQHYMIEHV